MDDLSAFGQLVKAIVPRAKAVAIFDGTGQPCWAPDEQSTAELRSLVLESLAAAPTERPAGTMRLVDGLPHYAFVVTDRAGEPLGALAFAVGTPHRPGEIATPESLAARVTPLLTLLLRDLGRGRVIETIQQRLDASAQVQWALDAVRPEAAPKPGSDPIGALLRVIVEKLEGDLIVVNAPGYHFEQVFARPTCQLADTAALRELAAGKLLKVVESQGEPLCVNKARTAGRADSIRLLSSALRHRGATVGAVSVFAHAERRPFVLRDAELLEHISPRLVELVDHRIDPATGLPTRAALEFYAPSAKGAGASGPRCVVYLDIDQMHVLNELFGFATGDDVLRRIAALWPGGRIPESGMIGRLSGDRFAAILDHCTLNQGRSWAEAARQRIEELRLPEPCRGFKLSASFGVAVLEADARFEAATALAATACRAAKDRGRNRVELFSEDDQSLLQRQDDLHVFRRLLKALEERRFRLLAQPIVALGANRGGPQYELLVRLVDDADGNVEPAKFLSAAKRYQLLPQLDRGVIERALAELTPFVPALEAYRARCWINLAGPSIGQPDFADWVRTAIKSSEVPGRVLGFEITEGAAIENIEAATRFILRVKELGCEVSLDDFGTGFSSLAYLKSLAVSAVKIDGGFIRDLLTDERSQALVSAVLEIARQLGLDTVAEFVETAEVAQRLTELGVTYGQGYFFGRPCALDLALRMLPGRAADPTPLPRLATG